MNRATVAEVDLAAIRHNYNLACSLSPDSRNVAVVKANAYGHGAIRVALELEKIAPALAVAIIDEAVELRDAGVRCPLLILEGANTAEGFQLAREHGFWLMLHHAEQIALLKRCSKAPVVWLKVDSGMHRLGVPIDAVEDLCADLLKTTVLAQELVLCTHLATADDVRNPFAAQQIERIRAVSQRLNLPLSIANSAGMLAWPDSHADWNRPGYLLYGNSPLKVAHEPAAGLMPAMRFRSEMIAVQNIEAGQSVGYGQGWTASRASRIGVVAVGYADGFPRHTPGGTKVLVNGRPAPLVGTVSMDMITVDLSDLPDANIGDPVILWGPELGVTTMAEACGTIGYELLCGVSSRVPRAYIDTA